MCTLQRHAFECWRHHLALSIPCWIVNSTFQLSVLWPIIRLLYEKQLHHSLSHAVLEQKSFAIKQAAFPIFPRMLLELAIAYTAYAQAKKSKIFRNCWICGIYVHAKFGYHWVTNVDWMHFFIDYRWNELAYNTLMKSIAIIISADAIFVTVGWADGHKTLDKRSKQHLHWHIYGKSESGP